jgi:hypothetical protein
VSEKWRESLKRYQEKFFKKVRYELSLENLGQGNK